MESIYKKPTTLVQLWFPIEGVDMQLICMHYYFWWLQETCGENSKWMLGGFTFSHHVKTIAHAMWAVIKSPVKQPQQKKSKKRKRKDYMFDSFTPIAIRKHRCH